MKKVLILIGAGYVENKCSASLIIDSLEKDSFIRICEVSKTRVHIRLKEFSTGEFDKVYLLGTSMVHNHFKIAKLAKKMNDNGTKIIWLSCLKAMDDEQEEKYQKYMELVYPNEHGSLFEVTRKYLGVKKGDELCKNLLKVISPNHSEKDEKLSNLIDAVSSIYRRFHDMKTLEEVIIDIANYKNAYWRDEYLSTHEDMIEEYYRFGNRELVGKSSKNAELKEQIKIVGKNSDCNVLINGETGTGKETIANLIHGYSNRNENLFIPFNCADLSPQLIESKLFGHTKGAFTGADKDTAGAFELADGGTLFLDELTELSPEVQAGLLRVIQEKRFRKLGSEQEIKVDIRIIGATNKDIFQLMNEGKFREDLYYRLSTVEIESLALRDNKEDIAHIANNFVYNKYQQYLSDAQIDILTNDYDWPGNVRELQNVIERAFIFKEEDFSKVLTEYKSKRAGIKNTHSEKMTDLMHEHTVAMLAKYKGNQTHAAKAMDISINTLKKYLNSDLTLNKIKSPN